MSLFRPILLGQLHFFVKPAAVRCLRLSLVIIPIDELSLPFQRNPMAHAVLLQWMRRSRTHTERRLDCSREYCEQRNFDKTTAPLYNPSIEEVHAD